MRLGAHSVSKTDGSSCGVRFLRHLLVSEYGPEAQLVAATACRAEGGGFDSRLDRCPQGHVSWKCVRRWRGACLLNRFTWVRFPPLPLWEVLSSRSSTFQVEDGIGLNLELWNLEHRTYASVRGVAATRHSSKVVSRVRLPPDVLSVTG